jgi:hypothetical protein
MKRPFQAANKIKTVLKMICIGLLTLPFLANAQFTYTTNDDNTITITGYTGPAGLVNIPTEIDGFSVTAIGADAFSGSSLNSFAISSSVIIPNSVTSIGDDAFILCYGLESVTIGDGVTNIGYEPFLGCNGLENVVLGNGVTSIGNYEFSSLQSLTNVVIGTNVTSIGSWAFATCWSLQNITIPSSVTNIDGYAFYTTASSPELSGIFFQGNAPSVGGYAFYGEDNATAYFLPGTTNWGSNFGGLPTLLWNPQAQTGDGGFGVQTNGFGFNITGTPNIPIVVDAITDLTQTTWTPLFNGVVTNGEVYFSDSQWTNYPIRFYRICAP